MKLSVVGYTTAVSGSNEVSVNDLKAFCGRQAGICYSEETQYFQDKTTNEGLIKRFDKVVSLGHHSIADHASITVYCEEIPKILAMLLNSLNMYTTSEKSARYTSMEGSSPLEVELYNKWARIIESEIEIGYPLKFSAREKTKLAKENARYFLSVFTPTAMSYTASLRQWNYILDWCQSLSKNLDTAVCDNNRYFVTTLKKHLNDFREGLLKLGFYVNGLRDLKGRDFTFLMNFSNEYLYNSMSWSEGIKEVMVSDFYKVSYLGSFALLAQAQRHRTLDYKVEFSGVPSVLNFYIPAILQGKEKESMRYEWLEDMRKVADVIPQGTLVQIVESGKVDNFLLKCKERLCGRAQLEIANRTDVTLQHLFRNKSNFNYVSREALAKHVSSGGFKVLTKCTLCGCKEPCVWGKENALSRLI